MKNGNPYGSHRVIEPIGVLPQPSERVNNDFSSIWDNEILIRVEALNVDSASFTQIKKSVEGDEQKVGERILEIVGKRGKMHNPVTGSGGVLIGVVEAIGDKLLETRDLKVGDKIVTLVSLSLTPLRLDEILEVKKNIDQVRVKGQAVLFESGIYAKLPKDLSETLAMAALDVAGAPAQTARLVKSGDTVVIVGATGKSGILCSYEAKKRAGVTGKVIGTGTSDASCNQLRELNLCDEVIKLDATDALACFDVISKLTNGKLADIIINNVSIPNTELGSILMCRDEGTIYFFSMATSFTKAALGAEGIGKDVNMIIGNGYTKGHDEITYSVLRESPAIMKLFEKLYC
ncbi:L-erythro-3,5-diaminohexanoate dehydrogenase [bacterium]|nr:L-erythro-3,5-diaminohexanoate dehydrogenase [bacterium]